MGRFSTENAHIAERLLEAARLIELKGGSRQSVAAYRAAGRELARHPVEARALFELSGVKGLDAIPRVGLGIATAIAEMLATHRWGRLERLRAEAEPAVLFESLPGIGEGLARRIRDELDVSSLEALETAARDGRLARLRGVGPRRAARVRGSLGHMLRP